MKQDRQAGAIGRRGNGRKGGERKKGAGTLERRANGLYVARWTVGGVRYTQSTGTRDRIEAEKALANFTEIFRLKNEADRLDAMRGKAEGVRGRLRELEKNRPAIKLADAWNAYIDAPERSQRISENRLYMCECRFRRLVDFITRRFPKLDELREIGREHVAAFLSDIGSMSDSTINAYVDLMRRVWDVLAENECAKLDGNPWTKVKRRRENPHIRRPLTPLELERVCGYVTGEMRLLFAVGIYTGLRLGDCATLKWHDVDMVRQIICVIPRKTKHSSGAAVTIPMHPALYAILRDAGRDASGYVMPSLAELYETRTVELSRQIQKVFKICGIETHAQTESGQGVRACVEVGFHSLRHTFVSLAANAGAPLALIQSIVGHSNTAMTRRYFHESENAMREAVALLPDVTASGSVTDGETIDAQEMAAVRVESHAGREEPPEGMQTPPDAPTRLAAFYAAFSALSPEERETAREWMAKAV